MGQVPTIVKTMRKLLRFGATARAARIAEKLTIEELTVLLPALPRSERCQLVEILLSTTASGEMLRSLPERFPALEQGLAAMTDVRLTSYFRCQPAEVSALVLQRLPKSRRAEIRCSFSPELTRSIDRHLPRGQKLGVKRDAANSSLKKRIVALFSLIF